MGTTKNYGWTTPEQTDKFDVPTSINTPVEQIDASLKTVEDKADAASTAASEAASKADAASEAAAASATDITTLTEQMAGTTDSGLKTLMAAKQDPITAGRDISVSDNVVALALNATNGTGTGSIVENLGGEYSLPSGLKASTDPKASGMRSHAEGAGTIASGEGSHAEGYLTEATGKYSHAEGAYWGKTSSPGLGATGNYSHSEGISCEASGSYSHAEGEYTHATETGAHAEGRYTTASDAAAHAEGWYTTAYGEGSHVEGVNGDTYGEASHADGYHTIAHGLAQHVFGHYNIEDTADTSERVIRKYVEIVGNGHLSESGHDAEHNARTLDWHGTEWCETDVRCGGTDMDAATYSLATLGDTVATIPAVEYGYTDTLTVPANSSIEATVTFGSEKAEAPNMQCSVQDKGDTMHKLTCCVGAVTTTTAAVTVWNDSDTDTTAVVDWLAISGR